MYFSQSLVFRDFASWIRATRLQAFEVVLDQWCALGTSTDIEGEQVWSNSKEVDFWGSKCDVAALYGLKKKREVFFSNW